MRKTLLVVAALLPAVAVAQINGGAYISATAIYASSVPLKGTNRQVFTSSGTWTKPSGYGTNARAFIQCWGGGGGGARQSIDTFGTGGGGGAYAERWVPLASLGGTETVTVGAGGAGRVSISASGAAGGVTTFGSWVSANGGDGGTEAQSNAVPTLGGSTMSAAASRAWRTDLGDTTTSYHCGPFGPFEGGSGRGGTCGMAAGIADTVYGGGGGGSSSATAANRTGGISVNGGNGGTGTASGGTPGAGVQPGGGGASGLNANGANGAAGQCNVTVFN